MKKAPTPSKANGALPVELPHTPAPALSPTLPGRTTKAWQALTDLIASPLTQLDWLTMGRGWRLAAAINTLGDLGWPIASCWVHPEHYRNPIKRYWLEPEGKRLAHLALKGAQTC